MGTCTCRHLQGTCTRLGAQERLLWAAVILFGRRRRYAFRDLTLSRLELVLIHWQVAEDALHPQASPETCRMIERIVQDFGLRLRCDRSRSDSNVIVVGSLAWAFTAL